MNWTAQTNLSAPSRCVNFWALRLDVQHDLYPDELTWSVTREANGQSVAPAGMNQYLYHLCHPGVYVFSIRDSWGDGICCQHGIGSFTLRLDGNLLWEMPDTFLDIATFTFEIVNDGRIPEDHLPPKPPSPVPPRRPPTAFPFPPSSLLPEPTPEAADNGSEAKSKWKSLVLLPGLIAAGAALLTLGCYVNCRRLLESANNSHARTARKVSGSCQEVPDTGAAERGRRELHLWDSSQEADLDNELDAPRLARSTPEQSGIRAEESRVEEASADALQRSESAMTHGGVTSDSQASSKAQSSARPETKLEKESGNRIWNVYAIPQRADVHSSTELCHIAPASFEHDDEVIIMDTQMSSHTPRNAELLQIRSAWSTCPSPADSMSSSKDALDQLMDDHKRGGVDLRQQVLNQV